MNELESLAAKLREARRILEREPQTAGILTVIQTLSDLGGLDQAGDHRPLSPDEGPSDYGGGT